MKTYIFTDVLGSKTVLDAHSESHARTGVRDTLVVCANICPDRAMKIAQSGTIEVSK